MPLAKVVPLADGKDRKGMIEKLTYDGTTVHVHLASISLKATKAFTHGSFVFDQAKHSLTMGQLPPVPSPLDLALEKGATLNFQLVAPDGTPRKQVRSGVLTANDKQPGIFRITGMAKTERRFPAEDGWGNEIYKYRAYFSHEGLVTDAVLGKPVELPQWLKGCIARQKGLWNRLAWLCRDARRRCSPVPEKEIIQFVQETILPDIDNFNLALGREHAKRRMKHPAKLKVDMPGLDGLWNFVGELRGRIEKERPVPEGLLEKVVEFAQQYKPDYTPLNEFLNDFSEIAEREAKALGMRRFEVRPAVNGFKAVLNRRKTTGAPWSEGWPLLKFPDRPRADDWGVHYYFNKAGVKSTLLEAGPGVPGLRFGVPAKPENTGLTAGCRAAEHALREAEICIPGQKDEPWRLRFGVLCHRPLPPNSHLKEWKLLFRENKLWLCLVVELQRPLPKPAELTEPVAGLDIGWRRTDDGIRFATLYESATGTIKDMTVDLHRSPKNYAERANFRIDFGPDRWTKSTFDMLTKGTVGDKHPADQDTLDRSVIWQVYKDWKPSDGIPGIAEIVGTLERRSDYLKDTAKIRLRRYLGIRTPPWLEKAGRQGLMKLREEFHEDAGALEILDPWREEDRHIVKFIALFAARATRRMEYGQVDIAHDVCKYLRSKGVGRLVIESKFLAKMIQKHDNEYPVSLKHSQKYRQFAAPGKFVEALKQAAVKYGMVMEEREAMNSTRLHHGCGHLNPATEKEEYLCEKCGRVVKQDHNAAMNLSELGNHPRPEELEPEQV